MYPDLSGPTAPVCHHSTLGLSRDMESIPRDFDDTGERQVTYSGRRGPCWKARSVHEPLGSTLAASVRALPPPGAGQPLGEAEDGDNFPP